MVVFPCVPATATVRFSRISSARIWILRRPSGAGWVVAKVDREIKTTPIGGGVLHYRTGRYVIMDAWLHPEPVNDFDLESARFVSTSRFLFTLGADGAPPANYAGAQHFRIDPYALAL